MAELAAALPLTPACALDFSPRLPLADTAQAFYRVGRGRFAAPEGVHVRQVT